MKLTEEIDSWLTHFYIESWIDKDTEKRYREELKQILNDNKLRELIEKWIERPECTYQTHKYLKSILEESKK